MSFTLGATKTATGFTTSTTTTPTYQFGSAGGDANPTKTTFAAFGTPSTNTSAVSVPGAFSKTLTSTATGIPAVTSSAAIPQFTLGNVTAPASSSSLNFSSIVTTAPSTFFTLTAAPSTTTLTTSASLTGFSLGSAVKPTAVGSPTTQAFGTTASTTTSAVTSLVTTSAASGSALPLGGILTFTQLEDAINKWTIDLEEQGKNFGNQAKQINAWDRLLISNGEKILALSNGIERVKQQQHQLDQELDFVLAQQKELEDLIVPLEKDLADIPVNDVDRSHTYQMAENLDSNLKQMSEDLKEIIEHLNEANKNQELSNPIIQIGHILSAHMNSLQWIDRNTTKISTHLDQIVKMHDMNRRNHELNFQKTYE